MLTRFTVSFEWSINCIGSHFRVGIASQLRQDDGDIQTYDQNAILFWVYPCDECKRGRCSRVYCSPKITMGTKTIYSKLTQHNTEDVNYIIRFRFQPDVKKLSIDSVRTDYSTIEDPQCRFYTKLLITLTLYHMNLERPF